MMAEGILRQLPSGLGHVAASPPRRRRRQNQPGDGPGAATGPARQRQRPGGRSERSQAKPGGPGSHAGGSDRRLGAPLIYPTNLPRLSFLAAATVRPAGQCSDRSDRGIAAGWSLVLLDLPSLAHAEVAPLAGACDGVYLVVRLGYTPRSAVAEAARVIRGAGGRLLGCAVVG